MVITIGGVKTPPSSRASAALVPRQCSWEVRAQRANSHTPLFSAVLFKIEDPGDVPQGPGFFLPPDWKSYPQERPLQSIMIRAIMLLEIES